MSWIPPRRAPHTVISAGENSELMHIDALRYAHPKTHIRPQCSSSPTSIDAILPGCCMPAAARLTGQARTITAEAAALQARTVCRGPARAPLLLFQRTADGSQQRSNVPPAAEGHVPAYGFPARSYAEDLAAWPGDSSESGRALPVLQVLWLNAVAMLLMILFALRMMWQPGLKF